MLYHERDPVQPWNTGASYLLRDVLWRTGSPPLQLGVVCRFEGVTGHAVALLDTGSAFSVLGERACQALENMLHVELGEPIALSTRLGRFPGYLHHLHLTFLAEQGFGHDLSVSATVLLAPEWPGPDVVGYGGCLERVRFAVEPELSTLQDIFYFGPAT